MPSSESESESESELDSFRPFFFLAFFALRSFRCFLALALALDFFDFFRRSSSAKYRTRSYELNPRFCWEGGNTRGEGVESSPLLSEAEDESESESDDDEEELLGEGDRRFFFFNAGSTGINDTRFCVRTYTALCHKVRITPASRKRGGATQYSGSVLLLERSSSKSLSSEAIDSVERVGSASALRTLRIWVYFHSPDGSGDAPHTVLYPRPSSLSRYSSARLFARSSNFASRSSSVR